MTWLRVDADMPWHDKVVGLPNDTARFAFVKALCAAKIRGRSTFTAASLREQLGSHARAIPALVTAGLLDEQGDMLTVHDFEEYQRKAGQVERQQRHRSVTPASRSGHTENVTETSPTEQDSTGRDKTSPPTPPRGTMMGFPPRSPKPGSHEGQHPNCGPCAPLRKPA